MATAKNRGLLAFLVGAGELPADRRVEVRLLQPGAQLGDLVAGRHALDGVGLDDRQPLAVAPLDGRHLLGRGQIDEIAGRHRPELGRDLQAVEGRDIAAFRREAHADVQLVVGVVGTEPAHQHPAGHELDRLADGQHVDAVAAGRLAVDGHVPLDAGRGAVVLQLVQLPVGGQLGLDDVRGLVQRGRVLAAHLHLDVLADRRAACGSRTSTSMPGMLATRLRTSLAMSLPTRPSFRRSS